MFRSNSLKLVSELTTGLASNVTGLTVKLLGGFVLLLLAACTAKDLRPGAERVIVTRQAAPESCEVLGNVVGEQGGSFTGRWTSNRNLMMGAINDLKNQAREMGGNYVVLEESKAGNTQSGSQDSFSGGQTDVTNMGTVYSCPEKGLMALGKQKKIKRSKRFRRAQL